MKATGIVRKVDDLGRVVIPMELRKTLGIGDKDPLEIFVSGETVVLKKYAPGCTFCGNIEIETHLFDKPICKGCTKEIRGHLKGGKAID